VVNEGQKTAPVKEAQKHLKFEAQLRGAENNCVKSIRL